jgi:hemolysin activation/secretion protein
MRPCGDVVQPFRITARRNQRQMVPLAVFALALVVWVSDLAQAQDYRRIAPETLPANPPSEVPAPPPLAPQPLPANADKVILPSLKGIRIVASGTQLSRQGAPAEGVVVEGVPLLADPAIRAALAAYIGKSVTLGALQAMQRAIEQWYRDHDRPFVVVYLPEQNIRSGTVQMIVSEFHVGQVHVDGNNWFSSDIIAREFGLASGDTLTLTDIRAGLDFVNSNSFRQVNSVLQPGADPLGTDILLQTQDRLPLRVYAGYENNGQPITGHDRWELGFNWGNALWLDQQFNYQFTSSDNFWGSRPAGVDPSFVSHSVDWIAPLPWQHKVELFGYYAEESPLLGPSFGQRGTSGQASLRYIVPLPPPDWLTHAFKLGYDYKVTNNNLSFGGVLVSATATEVDQFPIIYTATATDPYGNTTFENTFVFSPGGMTPLNTTAAFAAQTGSTVIRSNYAYDRVEAVRTTSLPWNTSGIVKVFAQFADRDLLPSEQLGLGGIESIRGYDERTASGSNGVLTSVELRSPPFRILPWAVDLTGDLGLPDYAQADAFWDYGSVHENDQVSSGVRGAALESAGMGLRYVLDRYLTFRLEYGFQLRTPPNATGHGQFGHVQLTLAY